MKFLENSEFVKLICWNFTFLKIYSVFIEISACVKNAVKMKLKFQRAWKIKLKFHWNFIEIAVSVLALIIVLSTAHTWVQFGLRLVYSPSSESESVDEKLKFLKFQCSKFQTHWNFRNFNFQARWNFKAPLKPLMKFHWNFLKFQNAEICEISASQV